MKILVYDTSGLFAPSLQDYLNLKIDDVSFRFECAATELKTQIATWKPTILLLVQDKARSNDKQHLDLLAETAGNPSPCRVIVLGDHPTDFVRKIFRAGVFGHIAPHTTINEVASCFEQVSKGRRFLDSGSLIRLMWMNEQDEILRLLENQQEDGAN